MDVMLSICVFSLYETGFLELSQGSEVMMVGSLTKVSLKCYCGTVVNVMNSGE